MSKQMIGEVGADPVDGISAKCHLNEEGYEWNSETPYLTLDRVCWKRSVRFPLQNRPDAERH